MRITAVCARRGLSGQIPVPLSVEVNMPARDIALAVFIQVLWGPIYTLCKPTLDWFPPLMMVALVYTILTVVLTPFVPRPKTPVLTLILISFFGGALQTSMVFLALK